MFKDKADDIVGYELDAFISYLANRHSIAKTKFSFNWDELTSALQQWALLKPKIDNEDKVDGWMEQNEEFDLADQLDATDDGDELDIEKYRYRERSRNLLAMKVQNYGEQIKDIFKASRDGDTGNDDSDDEKPDYEVQVRISRLSKVLKDMGHLLGVAFCVWDDYVAGNADEKKSAKDVVERIKKAMWKEAHGGVCIHALEAKGRRPGDGILKHGAQAPDRQPNGDQSEPEGTDKPKPDDRPASSKSDASNKQDGKAQADDQEDGTLNTDDTAGSPSRAILFEDEAYEIENKTHYIDFGSFIVLIKQFFDENDDLIVLDHLHEYDEQITEAFKAATDINYDPFKEKLKKTLEQYENTLIKGHFKDDKEREVTERIVQDIRNQIVKMDQFRSATAETNRESKKAPVSIEDVRK